MSVKTVLFVFLAFFTLFGDDLQNISSERQENESSKEYEQTDTSSKILPDLSKTLTPKDTVSLELQAERVRNHKHIVASAIMMMLFVGACMASVSSINPE